MLLILLAGPQQKSVRRASRSFVVIPVHFHVLLDGDVVELRTVRRLPSRNAPVVEEAHCQLL